MSAPRSLLSHEVRNVRASVLAASGAAAAGGAGAVLWNGLDDPARFEAAAPGIVGGAAFAGAWLAGAAAAADAFANDTATRRIERFVLLPVRLQDVFSAKALATALAMPVGLAVALLATLAAAAAFPGPAPLLHAAGEVPHALLVATFAVPVVAMTTLLAIVLEHALGSVVCGLVACAGVLVTTARAIPRAEWGVGPWDASIAGLVLAAILVAAARHAFAHGPVHLDRRWRRAALAFGAAALLAAPAAIASGAVLDWRADVAPGDRSAVPAALRLSPDGTRAVVLLGSTHAPQTCRAWLIDLDGGDAVPVPGCFRAFDRWEDEGLRLLALPQRGDGCGGSTDVVDPASGRVLRSRSAEADRRASDDVAPCSAAKVRDGVRVVRRSDGATFDFDSADHAWISPDSRSVALIGVRFAHSPGVPNMFVAVSRLEDHRAALPWIPLGEAPSLNSSGRFAVAWSRDSRRVAFACGDRLHSFDVEAGTAATPRIDGVVPGVPRALRAGLAVVCREADRTVRIVRTADGSVAAGPWQSLHAGFIEGSESLACVSRDRGPPVLVDAVTGIETSLPLPEGTAFAENLTAVGADGRVWSLDARGRIVRVR